MSKVATAIGNSHVWVVTVPRPPFFGDLLHLTLH